MKLGKPQLLGLALTLICATAHAELIGLYRFDDITGTSATESVASNDASWVPGSQSVPDWQPAAGLIGGAVRLPGSGTHENYFEIASIPEINGTAAGMTIAVWFKPQGNSGYRGIVMSRDVVSAGDPFGIGHENDHLDGRVNGNQIDSAAGSLTATGDWFHIAWVWDNAKGNQQLFINGTATGSPKSVSAHSIDTNGDWRIGDDSCCANRNLDGYLDDLAIYDEALTGAAINALYTNGLDGFSADEQPPPPNTDPLNVGLVINEIHHDASPKTDFVEFIELLNTGPAPIDISGYRFDGIGFVFPAGSVLDVTEYAVIGENPAETYHYAGALSGDGERITLRDAAGAIIDRVDYGIEFPWPVIDEGMSMQLTNATLDNDLGGSWRPALPTPGFQNATFSENAPPQLRHVSHDPQQPTSADAITVSIKATDPDGMGSLTLHFQTNAPGAFVPAFLPLPRGTLQGSPGTPLSPNPAFEQNWIGLPMTPDTTGEIFAAVIPAQAHRTLVRYRITASDPLGNSIRAPFPEDASLNFATFVYDGVPDYTANGTTHPSSILTTIPVYHLLTDPDDLVQCWAYDSADRVGGVEARGKYNWEGAVVYDGVTYDHVKYRLRQRNDRYAGAGRRSMKFRFPRGNYFQARDPEGKIYPVKWRTFNTSKMSRFAEGANHGMRELISSRLWNLAGVVAPEFQHVHFRVVDGAGEQPDQYHGDFYGLSMIFEDVDAQFLESRDLPKGNVYKLKDGEPDPLDLQKYQARTAVSDGSDFINIRDNLGPPPTKSDAWLGQHVDWDSWHLYAALGEGFRHYDFSPYWGENRIWYFRPEPGTPFGLMSVIPHDTDATWRRGTNDSQWDDPTWGPSPGFRGRVVGVDLPKEAIQEVSGLNETDGENHPERDALMLEYRNVIREVRDLLWQPETVNAVIDQAYETIAAIAPADRARWSGGPADAGIENIGPLENQVSLMKQLAFNDDLYMGSSLAGGRAQWLSKLADDPAIPITPSLSRSGHLLISSPFADPDGADSFRQMQWRIAETNIPFGGNVPLVSSGDLWRYFDLGTDPGADWTTPLFDDAAWANGQTKMGYGDENEITTLEWGRAAIQFRKTISITEPTAFGSFEAGIVRDDGAIVYVNGTEVWRNQMPDGPVTFETLASSPAYGANEREFQPFTIPASAFSPGENTIAVEVHQTNALSDDMGFDFQLEAVPIAPEPKYEWHATWTAEGTTPSITPPAAATRADRFYRARIRHQDTTGRWSHWSEPVEFVAEQPDISLYTDSLVISEFSYHPSAPSAAEAAAGFTNDDSFEYIEIRNVGPQALDLSDVRFTKGIDIDLAGTLAPDEHLLVVNNTAAFEFRYGAGHPIAGEWTGKLDNRGEQIKLSFGAGQPIRDFSYDDASPWPSTPDGAGHALILVDPRSVPDHNSPISWRPSPPNPGQLDTTTFPGGDFLTYAIDSSQPAVIQHSERELSLTIQRNLIAEDLIFTLQSSDDLQSWADTPSAIINAAPTSGNYATTTFRTSDPSSPPKRFLRLLIEAR